MSLLKPDDTWPLLAIMVVGTSISIWLEQRYRWGARLSAPVIALLIAMALSNARVVPMAAPAYDFVGDWLVPIALPLLLFRANLFQIFRSTGKMMAAFHVAAIGTVIGAIVAFMLLGSQVPEPDKTAAIMTGSYIGGMVNFVALQESLGASESLISALIVADNLVMAASFLMLLWVAANPRFQRWFGGEQEARAVAVGAPAGGAGSAQAHEGGGQATTLLDVALSLAVACGVAGVAMFFQKYLARQFPEAPGDAWFIVMVKTLLTNRFVLITALSLVVGTLFSRPLSRINGSEPLGAFLLYMFLFTVGLPADFWAVVVSSPKLFVFCGIMAVFNIGFALAAGKVLRLPLPELVLACNATLGGPPTAAAMAMAKQWPRLVLPALLAGLWGYVVATPIGLLIASMFSR